MNKNDRHNVTASLFMLREMKRRQDLVNRGYQLLRRKTEALRFRGRLAAAELSSTQMLLDYILKDAYISLAAIKFTTGEPNALVLETIGEAQIRVKRIPENIAGVATVSLQAIESDGAGDELRYLGLGSGGHRIGEARKAFREAVRILLKFASLRNTCILLNEAIKSTLRHSITKNVSLTRSQQKQRLKDTRSSFVIPTSRKVNGIEKVIIPKLKNTEAYILMEIDEREREEFHRLKMVKAKKVRGITLAKMRKEASSESSGDSYDDFSSSSSSRSINHNNIRSMKYLTNILYTCNINAAFSTTTESGDYEPTCLPLHWDDEDLIF